MTRDSTHGQDSERVGQVSELAEETPEPISPGDATSGAPSDEPGEVQESPVGPEAPPEQQEKPRDRD